MPKGAPVLLALLLATVAFTGCIGGEDLSPQQSAPGAGAVADAPATIAVVHGADATRLAGDAANAVLPDGVPLPVGAARVTGFGAFEPTIGVTSDGALFIANIGGSLVTDHSSVIRSTDQGATWEDVTPSIGPVSSPPNSNDPYVYVDEATDRVYNLDMQGLACNWIQWSDDNGESWTQNPLGCGQPPVLDHPTIFAGKPTTLTTTGYENVVYLCVNRVADSACATSLDGGLTWLGFRPVYPGYDPAEAEADASDPVGTAFSGLCGGLHAHGTTAPDGTAYLPKGQCGVPMVAISEDNGLTWELVTITEDVDVNGHEVAFAVDAAGNAYAFWVSTDRKPYLAVSTDGGWTWADPVQVTPPGVGTVDKPTIAAGADGRVALAYVGTRAEKAYDEMEPQDTWNAYITTIVNATSAQPTLMTVTANDPADPIARGVCGGTRCWGDGGESGDRGGALGDFIDVVIDDEGRPWAAFVDVCTTDQCLGGGANDVGVAFAGTLAQGPALRGDLAPLAELPVTLAGGAE